jgi:hypothetical protein
VQHSAGAGTALAAGGSIRGLTWTALLCASPAVQPRLLAVMLRQRPSPSDLQACRSRRNVSTSWVIGNAADPGQGVHHTLKAHKHDIWVRHRDLCVHHGLPLFRCSSRCGSSTYCTAFSVACCVDTTKNYLRYAQQFTMSEKAVVIGTMIQMGFD